MMLHGTHTGRRQAAFTLAEMLVVLVILAALAFVAVEALRPIASQTRFDATRTTMENVRRAIVGESHGSDAAGAVRGFIADTGRFPDTLNDLVQLPADQTPTNSSDPPFGLRQGPGSYSSVLVPAGWRGPYLLVTPGTPTPELVLRDGWGVPLVPAPPALLTPDGTGTVTISSPVTSSRIDSAPEYAVDISVSIRLEDWKPALVAGSLYRLDSGVKAPPTSAGTWRVAILGPGRLNGPQADPGGVKVINASVDSDSTGQISYSIIGGPSGELTIGPRVIQATLDGEPVGRPVYVHLQGGSTHLIDLQVQ